MHRTLIAAIMAATALAPATAFAQDHGERGASGGRAGGGQHDGGRPAGGQHQGGGQPAPRAQAPQAQAPQQVQAPARAQQPGRSDFQQGNRGQGRPDFHARQFRGNPATQAQPNAAPQAAGQDRQGWRGGNPQNRQGWRGGPQQGGRDGWQNGQNGQAGRPDARGNDRQAGRGGNGGNWQGRNGGNWQGRNGNGGNWNRNWRQDHRYDWNGYRSRNRNAFHLPRYYAPYGWDYGYRRFSTGFILSSMLYGENYWIDDPYYYELPPAYGPYRWVRYYNDALLVDIYTGEVVDTVYDIFW
jgi:Nickel/cobalt transporter regulator